MSWVFPTVLGGIVLLTQILYQNMRQDDIRQTEAIDRLNNAVHEADHRINLLIEQRDLMLQNLEIRLKRINERLEQLEQQR